MLLHLAPPPQVRPVVHEEVRLEADDDMRRLIQGIKVSRAASLWPLSGCLGALAAAGWWLSSCFKLG